jgi:hypothetical protein
MDWRVSALQLQRLEFKPQSHCRERERERERETERKKEREINVLGTSGSCL